jgi:hypothetical protein
MREQSALGGCPDIRMNLFMFIIGVGRGKPPVPTDEEIPPTDSYDNTRFPLRCCDVDGWTWGYKAAIIGPDYR